jgi:hypothetical protein
MVEGMIEYFCYVSRNKVDQLYEQLNPEADYELTELRKKETSLTADAHMNWGIGHLLSLFRVGGTYGKKGMIQRELKIKQSYMTKLEAVSLALAKQTPILPAEEIPQGSSTSSGWFHHSGLFRVETAVSNPRVDAVVTLTTALPNRLLLLDCSLRNFSEGPMADGTFTLSSANARFFLGDAALPMTTIFLLIESTAGRVVGSPLFLKITVDSADRMTAL